MPITISLIIAIIALVVIIYVLIQESRKGSVTLPSVAILLVTIALILITSGWDKALN